jgi:CRP/FNR family cyclic AMP-dependent transcriptional regulator
MIKRFEGIEGHRRLIDVLENCKLVKHDKDLAKKLADVGTLSEFAKADVLMTEGDADNDIYFILAGEVEVTIKKNIIAKRKVGDAIGEMAILDSTQPRSATIKALETTVVLKVTEPDFTQLANEHSHLWKSVAEVAGDRLRQRSTLLTARNEDPILFIGCSVESLDIGKEIELGLKHSKVQTQLWTNGVFTASESVIDNLLSIVNEADFALFIFGPDDEVKSRGATYNAPRDNIVFELGLFMGKLERNRTFIVKEDKADVKIPSDLLGINKLTYVVKKKGDYTNAVSTVCTELNKVFKSLGPR